MDTEKKTAGRPRKRKADTTTMVMPTEVHNRVRDYANERGMMLGAAYKEIVDFFFAANEKSHGKKK